MAKSISVITKKRGRPVTTGKGTLIGVRLLDEPLTALDHWIARQQDKPSRPEAIRRLVELGLAVKPAARPSTKAAARAAELAANAIDKHADTSAPADEQASRRRRLIKGPEAFRDVRVDRPKEK